MARSMWDRYCRGVDAIIFVVDSHDRAKLETARFELHSLLDQSSLVGVPLLVLGNKNDLEGAMPVQELIKALQLETIQNRPVSCYSVSSFLNILEWNLTILDQVFDEDPAQRMIQKYYNKEKERFLAWENSLSRHIRTRAQHLLGHPRRVQIRAVLPYRLSRRNLLRKLRHDGSIQKEGASELFILEMLTYHFKDQLASVSLNDVLGALEPDNEGVTLNLKSRLEEELSRERARKSVIVALWGVLPLATGRTMNWKQFSLLVERLMPEQDPKGGLRGDRSKTLVLEGLGLTGLKSNTAVGAVVQPRRQGSARTLTEIRTTVAVAPPEKAARMGERSDLELRPFPGESGWESANWEPYAPDGGVDSPMPSTDSIAFGYDAAYQSDEPIPAPVTVKSKLSKVLISKARTRLPRRDVVVPNGVLRAKSSRLRQPRATVLAFPKVRPPSPKTSVSGVTLVNDLIPYVPDGSSNHPLRRLLRDADKEVPVPQLAHGLDRVLFQPAVHWVQDPNSGAYNFPPQLQHIPSVKSFAFEKVSRFIRSSEDSELWSMAIRNRRKFTGSTSSLTFIMTHLYCLMSRCRRVDISPMSLEYIDMNTKFTSGMRSPGSVFIKHSAGVYAFDGSSGADDDIGLSDRNVLSWMGTMLEKYLTLPPNEFDGLLRSTSDQSLKTVTRGEAYQYSASKKFVMRSQLDCVDPRLPGTGYFDIKTRAAVAIRHDRLNYERASGYQIRTLHGLFESFEREYYDLIRSAMIKYNFQARIGHMDGIFVAYHNTAKIFGFQYLSLSEMDDRLFGGRLAGDRVFAKCVELLEHLADAATSIWPAKDIKCTFESTASCMRLWVQPVAKTVNAPITELTLRVENWINGELVQGTPDLNNVGDKWSVRFNISKATEVTDASVKERFQSASRKQYEVTKMVLPEGVSSDSHEEILKMWEDIDFGGPALPAVKPNLKTERDMERFKEMFGRPYPLVLETRRLAQKGRLEEEEAANGCEEGVEEVVSSDSETTTSESESSLPS
ncbi:hypothetical protein FRB97_007022 [Tulasnella sp. 331]|nr:hypothetical protein FRB97_007022 [Tulasnella sp. 331]